MSTSSSDCDAVASRPALKEQTALRTKDGTNMHFCTSPLLKDQSDRICNFIFTVPGSSLLPKPFPMNLFSIPIDPFPVPPSHTNIPHLIPPSIQKSSHHPSPLSPHLPQTLPPPLLGILPSLYPLPRPRLHKRNNDQNLLQQGT